MGTFAASHRPNCKLFVVINITGWPQSSSRGKRTNCYLVYKLGARTVRWERVAAFGGSDLSISHLFSIISRKNEKVIFFIDIEGGGGKMSETATCFQQHYRMDLHFSCSSLAD
jgi:hypothetical protein